MKAGLALASLIGIALLSAAACAADADEGVADAAMMKRHLSRMHEHMQKVKAARNEPERVQRMQEHLELLDEHLSMITVKLLDEMPAPKSAKQAGKPKAEPGDGEHRAHHPGQPN
jgi:hypothetical protein